MTSERRRPKAGNSFRDHFIPPDKGYVLDNIELIRAARAFARLPVLPCAGRGPLPSFVFPLSGADAHGGHGARTSPHFPEEMLYNISSPVPQPPRVRGDFAPLAGRRSLPTFCRWRQKVGRRAGAHPRLLRDPRPPIASRSGRRIILIGTTTESSSWTAINPAGAIRW